MEGLTSAVSRCMSVRNLGLRDSLRSSSLGASEFRLAGLALLSSGGPAAPGHARAMDE